MTLPETFVQRLVQIVPSEQLPAVLATFDSPKQVGFRINRLKRTLADVQQDLRGASVRWQVLEWYEAGGFVEPSLRSTVVSSPLVAAGDIYVQNPSSMLAALALGAQPDEQVLDLAAAPGGKALLLAECMLNRGYLAAVEAIRSRFFLLRRQLELAGVRNARTFLADGRRIGGRTPNRFDRVLLDAPCSGESRFRADDHTSWRYWSPRKIREQSRKQRGLLLSALKALRPGGTLIYATCSFAPEENEQVVDFALRRSGGTARLVPVNLPIANVMPGLTSWQTQQFDESLVCAIRILPTSLYDGLFLARLTKD